MADRTVWTVHTRINRETWGNTYKFPTKREAVAFIESRRKRPSAVMLDRTTHTYTIDLPSD